MLVLWSGGLDSTRVLIEQIESNAKPRALVIDYHTVPAQEQQKRARKAILAEISVRYGPDAVPDVVTAKVRFDGGWPRRGDHGPFQQPAYLTTTAGLVDDGETLAIGWIDGDSATADLARLQSLFDTTVGIMGKPNARLAVPLRHETKYAVIDFLHQRGMDRLCWYCEGFTDSDALADAPCGRCHPCLVHQTARWQLANFPASALYRSEPTVDEKPVLAATGVTADLRSGWIKRGDGSIAWWKPETAQ